MTFAAVFDDQDQIDTIHDAVAFREDYLQDLVNNEDFMDGEHEFMVKEELRQLKEVHTVLSHYYQMEKEED